MQKLALHTRAEHDKQDARDQRSYRDCSRDLRGFFLVHRGFDGTEFCHFLLLVVVEIGVDKSNHSENQQDDSEKDDEALYRSETITIPLTRVRNPGRHTRAAATHEDTLIE
jgi:hypothetical protein